jgi:hypothetical protein
VAAEVDTLVARRLILPIDGHYLSIALRPRDELVEGFHKAREFDAAEMAARTASPSISDGLAVQTNNQEMLRHG